MGTCICMGMGTDVLGEDWGGGAHILRFDLSPLVLQTLTQHQATDAVIIWALFMFRLSVGGRLWEYQ